MNGEQLSAIFADFVNLLRDRFSREDILTSEDSIRYTLFYCLIQNEQLHPSNIMLEYPYENFEGELDTFVVPGQGYSGLAFECKYHRGFTSGQPFPRPLSKQRGQAGICNLIL
ncbi:hypothetical protein KAX75_13570 [candidate division WOR-3 bacterium]|nr:hypothetical protein [candidate division WOR-3 bacterium]